MGDNTGQPYNWWGEGGSTYALSGRYYVNYERETFSGLDALGVKVGSIYLDQYDAVPPMEDFSPAHPATREQDLLSPV
jgi:hypothetical protein